MLRYCLPFFICVPLCASEKAAKQEEKRFALKKDTNVFDIKLSLLPALDTMVTDLMPFVAPEQPQAILSSMAGVPEDVLTTLNNVQTAITKTEPLFFTKMNYWAQHNKYVTPNDWDSIVSEYLSPSKFDVSKLIECATVAARYENLGLAHVILTVVADRLIQGESTNTLLTIENSDLDLILARMIISKALLENTPCSIMKAPVQLGGQISAPASSALLCRTAAKKGCCLVTNQIAGHFQTYTLNEESVLNQKWLHMLYHTFVGTVIATDASSDLHYQVLIIKEKDRPRVTVKVLNTVEDKFSTINHTIDQNKEISVIFENDGYNFYLKTSDNIFKSNAKKIHEAIWYARSSEALLEPVTLHNMDDLFIKKQFEKGRGLCRCLEQKQIAKFDMRVLHTITYSTDFLSKLKKAYSNANFNIIQTACNYDAYTHSLLMQDATNANLYYAARVSFPPDLHINPFLACMNNLPSNNGTLYAHALCLYHLYTHRWLWSSNRLERTMGLLYRTIDPSMKAIIGEASVRAKNPLSHYSSLIKQSISFLRLPAMAAAAVGSIGLGALYPFATLLTIPLSGVLAYRWTKNYQQRHTLKASEIKDWLGGTASIMFFVSMLYLAEKQGKISFGDLLR